MDNFMDFDKELSKVRGSDKPKKDTNTQGNASDSKVTPKPLDEEKPSEVVDEKSEDIVAVSPKDDTVPTTTEATESSKPVSNPNEPKRKHSENNQDGSQKKKSVVKKPKQVPQSESVSIKPSLDWKGFKTLTGMFDLVGGGARPVVLNENIKESRISGFMDPILTQIQKNLKEKYLGSVVCFPWGEFKITKDNRVFTTNTTLGRYLMFDGLRDDEESHIQYAKQWLASKHSAFDEMFDPKTNMKHQDDELDIYSLLVVSSNKKSAIDKTTPDNHGQSDSEASLQMIDKINMSNVGIGHILKTLKQQEKDMALRSEKEVILQTVMLLDSMGLLKGGIPKSMGGLLNLFENNREEINKMDVLVEAHIQSEEERLKTMHRTARYTSNKS